MTTSTPSRGAARWALLSLAIGSFGIGMTEFVVLGLLPNVATELLPDLWSADPEAAIAQAGWIVSCYALGVVVGAPTLAGALARFSRQRVLLILAGALALFTIATIAAPTFGLVAVSRFLAGLPHGAYFGIAALVAGEILGPGNRARGAAYVLSGLTIANVVGVPAGTFLGQQLGWRAAILVVALIFVVTVVMIALTVPKRPGDPSRSFRAELSAFRRPQLWLTLAVGAIGFGGFFAVYSYVATLVTEVAKEPEWVVPLVLVAIGVGMTIGNLVGGHFADQNVTRTLVVGTAAMVVALVALGGIAAWLPGQIFFVFAVGFLMGGLSPALQTRLIDVAGGNDSIAASLNHSGLNVGNALGAALGGFVIAHGFGYAAPVWVGAILAAIGLVILSTSIGLERCRVGSGAGSVPTATGSTPV